MFASDQPGPVQFPQEITGPLNAHPQQAATAGIVDPSVLPQVLENVRFKKGSPLDDEKVKSSIESANAKLGPAGRILVRKSGTEPLIRVMAEGEDEKVVRAVVRQIASAIEEVAA